MTIRTRILFAKLLFYGSFNILFSYYVNLIASYYIYADANKLNKC